MTLADFFLAVNAAGIRLATAGGQLQLRGPANDISPEIRAGAAEHESVLLTLLPADPADGSTIKISEVPGSCDPTHRARGEATSDCGFRHDHDWRDWRAEWLLELGALTLRMRGCQDQDVLARLGPLVEVTPTSQAGWLALGRQIVEAEHELRQLGKLPPYPWPARGES